MAQAPHVPDNRSRRTVQVMRAHGIPLRIVCKVLQIDEKTLKKYYRDELKDAHLHVEAAMGAAIVAAAQKGHWGAAKYWLMTQGDPRWRITEGRLIGGMENAPPVPVEVDTKVTIYLPDNGRSADKEETE